MTRKELIVAGHYYHIFNRGVNREPIFFQRGNWLFFLKRLKEYFKPEVAGILAYCLMPNHYHLLVQARCDNFAARVMQPLTVSFTKAINKEQNRVGPLFQGPYQFRRIDSPQVLLHLSRYIHLNPVAAGLAPQPAAWEFSSYREYVQLRRGTLPDTEMVLSYFDSPDAYASFVCSKDHPAAHLPGSVLIDN